MPGETESSESSLKTEREKAVEKLRRKRITPAMLKRAVRKLVNYSFDDEEKDFLDEDHTATLDVHIFGSITILDEAIKRRLI